jgi:formamidopyrimidine-DNA glycosylase
MPELPEVEAVRRGLEQELVGKRIASVVVTGRRSVRRYADPQAFIDELVDARVAGVGRRGKHLLVHLDDGRELVVHLRMSGQLLWVTDRAPAPKHTHVVLTTDPAGTLRFVDPRTFGEMFLSAVDPATGEVPELAHFGIEPLAPTTTIAAFGERLRSHRVKLKPLLMDQRVIVGIGNIYSDEMLFRAGLRWDRVGNTLSDDDVARLYDAMVSVLRDAIDARGSSLRDAQYVDLYGRTGDYAAQHQVHARAGEPCVQCGRVIVRERVAGRSTYFCETCQG